MVDSQRNNALRGVDMTVEFPRCARCRATIHAGESVRFRSDSRVEHATCPALICPVCGHEIRPGTPIRRDGAEILHGNCWLRRYRAEARRQAGGIEQDDATR